MLLGMSLAACSGGISNTSTTSSIQSGTVAGTVSGLSGVGLVLQNNGTDNLTVAANGSFQFATALIPGDSYSVTVLVQPSAPAQTCVVSNGTGIVSSNGTISVNLECTDKTTATDTIGGVASGVLGSGLVLQDNGGDDLAVTADGSFTFPTALGAGQPYNVTVLSPPINPYENCIVSAGSGTTGGDNVANVAVACSPNSNPTYTIGGTVFGVSEAEPVVLVNNGRNQLTLTANGAFTFSLPIPSGSTYNVTAVPATGQQSQTCTFTNGSGTVGSANVTNVTVACQTNVPIPVSVSGLAGSGLVLQDNGTDNLLVPASGAYTFATALVTGAAYRVAIVSQPSNPAQTCVVNNATGTAGSGPPATVNCSTNSYSVGGTLTGLAGSGLTVQDNGGARYALSANGAFTLPGALPSGSAYSVGVASQPANPSQTCTVSNGAGTVTSANVTNVAVTCVTQLFTIGGTVNGLAGTGLTVRDNAGASYAITANGAFTIPGTVASGATYAVSVSGQPTNPSQTCTVSNGAGTVTSANVTNVAVTCVTQSFTIGGTVNGLAGSGLTVRDNAGASYAITANGAFTIPGTVVSGATYSVSVSGQPTNPSQICTATNNSGTVTTGNITNVVVTCVTQTFTVGGTVSGLAGSGLAVQDNSGNSYAITANGAFTIPGTVASGATYAVSVSGQPTNPSQTCTATNDSGTVTTSNITSVVVTCVTQTFTVGGTVSGLAGTGLAVKDNGGNSYAITANGAFTIPGTVASGATYAVSVSGQPTNPSQTCTATNDSGTVTTSNVTSVVVTCVTPTYTVGGTVNGLAGSSIVLQNQANATYTITANGPFTFPGAQQSGTSWSLTVTGQPSNPTQVCTVNPNSGVIGTANITNVAVSCVTQSFTVGGTVSGLKAGDTVTLGNQGNELRVTGNPPAAQPFNFPAQLSGTAYAVTVDYNDGYTCVVTNGGGTVTNANVTNVAVTCGVINAYLYVTNSADGTISSYGLDLNFGALLPLPGGVVPTGTQTPVSIAQGCGAVSGTEGEILVANEDSNSISTYAVNYTSGALTAIGTPVPTSPRSGPVFLDYSPTGCVAVSLFGASDSASSYSDDDGELTAVTNPLALGANSDPIASTNLTLPTPITSEYVVDSASGNVSQLYVNTTTGALLASANTVSAGSTPDAIVADSMYLDGNPSESTVYAVYVANAGSNTISEYSVDSNYGVLSPLVESTLDLTVPTGSGPSALATASFYLSTQPQAFVYYLYVANAGDGTISGYSVYPGTATSCLFVCPPAGKLTPIVIGGAQSKIPSGGTGPVSLSVWSTGSTTFLYVVNKTSNTVTVFSIAPTTGALTQVGTPVSTGASPTSATLVLIPGGII
jgi:6-phosphogluconolactonase (cycloisomerase 2 family)